MGMVISIFPFGEGNPITKAIPYNEALRFVRENQEDLKVYRVAQLPDPEKKGAKRKMYKMILAHDHAEAFAFYADLMKTADPNHRYQLLSGNWQPLEF